jgi:hypothetical protein
MDYHKKHHGSGLGFLPWLAVLMFLVPVVIWLDVVAILWWERSILPDGVHDFHNRLPAAAQIFLWLGLPLMAAVLGLISLRAGIRPKLSRRIVSASVILSILAVLAALRPH